jgi:predicted Fe-Mo cluster-binding NifX family protein
MHMSSRILKIAIPTKRQGGLEDVVSDVFGRANTFTILEVEKGAIKSVKVLENPAASYAHGAGPIVVKMLIDSEVNMVLAAEFGPGASELLEHHKITMILVEANIAVAKAIKEALSKLSEPNL